MKKIFCGILLSLLILPFQISFAENGSDIPDGLHYKEFKSVVPRDTRSLFKKALKNLQKDKPIKADEYFTLILKKHENFYAYWGRAICHWKMENDSLAKKHFLLAYSHFDTINSFLINYAEFALSIKKNWTLVQELTVKAYSLSKSDDALSLLVQGGNQLNASESALKQLKILTEKYPTSPNTWVFYASLLSKLEMDNDAAKVAKHAVSLAQDPYQLKIMAFILAKSGQFIESANTCEKILKIAKKSAHSYEAWGFLEYKQGHYENATYNYKEALEHDYKISTLLTLARLYHLHLDNPKTASHYCKAALNIERNLPDPYYLLAEISRKNGDLKSALSYSKVVLKLTPNRVQSYYYHGKLLYENKDFNKAVIYFEKSLEMKPADQRYRLILAKAYAGAGLMEKAKETYSNFINEPLKDFWLEENPQKEGLSKQK